MTTVTCSHSNVALSCVGFYPPFSWNVKRDVIICEGWGGDVVVIVVYQKLWYPVENGGKHPWFWHFLWFPTQAD